MRRLFFITHADVVIDPDVPVPQWRLSERGRARHEALALAMPPLEAVYASTERKAQDGAEILANALGLTVIQREALGENDRSATGFLPKEEFERTAATFFAEPDSSVRGWERAVDAQRRIVAALKAIEAETSGDVAVVAHGGVGSLTRAHLMEGSIGTEHGQPGGTGGNMLEISLPGWTLRRDWIPIESWSMDQVS